MSANKVLAAFGRERGILPGSKMHLPWQGYLHTFYLLYLMMRIFRHYSDLFLVSPLKHQAD